MRQTRPLPDTHPELTVLRWPGFTEYRVAHFRLARDGSGRIVGGTSSPWLDLVLLPVLTAVAVAVVWRNEDGTSSLPILDALPRNVFVALALAIGSAWFLWTRFTQILHESLLVFPTLGIQLETHRGHPLLASTPFLRTTARRFIPLSALEDVVIHEGFRRWGVRYYLAAIHRSSGTRCYSRARAGNSYGDDDGDGGGGGGMIQVHVAFENLLPYFPVLKEVYLGVQETLFPLPTLVVETDAGADADSVDTGMDTKDGGN